MKRQLLSKIIVFLLLLPIQFFAQSTSFSESDITGLWKGSLYNDTTKKNLPYEIAISEDKGKLSGYSYTLFDIDGKKELGVKKIKITRRNDQLFIEDIVLISNNYSEPPPRKVRQQSVVNLLVNDTAMQLTGKWSTNRTKEYLPLTGSLQLVREIEYRPLVLFKKLVELKLDKDLSFVKTEKKGLPDVAIKENATSDIKLPVALPPASADVDKPNENSPAPEGEKLEEVPDNKPAIRVMQASVQPITNARIGKTITLPLPGRKKEVVAAANYRKKETIQPESVNPGIIIPATVTKKTEPVAVTKEPAKKDAKPPVAIVTKPVINEKPKTIPVAVVNNRTAPVSEVKAPVKKESQPTTVIVAPIERKKELPVAIADVIVTGAAANVSERKMNKEQSVFFESDSLVLTLYDNGDVDGDTVSVLMNGRIIFAKQGLSTTAHSKTIYIDKGTEDSLSMIMYAENLGSIPPNTGLLIIMDGEKRYEVRFSADLKTNGAILLRRKIKEK